MSVIAGCSLFSGVIVVSDCRVTIQRSGKPDIYCDVAQKLFALTPEVVLGFVGDIGAAGPIIRNLLAQIAYKRANNKTRELHPLLLTRWLPRYLRSAYKQLSNKWTINRIDFLVGGVIKDRRNIIERAKVVKIMDRFLHGNLSMQRSWLPGILVDILQTHGNNPFVVINNVPANLLFYMKSPNFTPHYLKPLEYTAIGSGKETVIDIDKYADWVFAGEVGNSFMEAMAIREVVQSFIDKHSILSVGGLYPTIKISNIGVEHLGYASEAPVGGARISLSVDNSGRWSQNNLSTNKEIKLLFPWEINAKEYDQDKRFDDLKEALNKMKRK